MKPQEIIAKVRKIEIKARRLVDELVAGAYHSIFKGKGVEFSEVREYVDGDDIRDIDWNVTAKMNGVFVKQFTEERELNVFVMVDVSASNKLSYKLKNYYSLSVELASLFIFSAIGNNDNVGLMLFSDCEELYIPAKKGKNHALNLVREMVIYEPKKKGTNIRIALEKFLKSYKKRSTVFLISDLLDKGFERSLKIVNQKHDLIIIYLHNQESEKFSIKGFVNLEDTETGQLFCFKGDKKGQKDFLHNNKTQIEKNINFCNKAGVDIISITDNKNYISILRKFFKKRSAR